MPTSVEEEELTVGNQAAEVGEPAHRIGGPNAFHTVLSRRRLDLEALTVDDAKDLVDAGVGITSSCIEMLTFDAGLHPTPVDMQLARLLQVQGPEVCLMIREDGAALLESGLAKVNRLCRMDRVAPTQVVVPGPHSDVPIQAPPRPRADLSGAKAVIHDLVIVVGEEDRQVAVPGCKLVAASEVDFLVFPGAGKLGNVLEQLRHVGFSDANLCTPLPRQVGAKHLIGPVAVLDGEVEFLAVLPEDALEDWDSDLLATGAWLPIAASELERKVKQPPRIPHGVAVIALRRERAKPAARSVVTPDDQLVVIASVGL